MGKTLTIDQSGRQTTGTLTHFLIEPFVPHETEYYAAVSSERDGDTVLFSPKGGVDIEEVWDTVRTIKVPVLGSADEVDFEGQLPADLGADRPIVAAFLRALQMFAADHYFSFLEINPFAVVEASVIPFDTKARVDDTASFQCMEKWGKLEFPKPFGTKKTAEELHIEELDAKTGASLKLTILNPKGRVWTMVAGGGASVIYADTVVDLGYAGELANYGEYSGNPSTEDTYEYARTILDLMTREKDPEGRPKFLIIGGGIANFTDVAKTFTGIIMALKEYKEKLQNVGARIYVRRGGPNYKVGLEKMRRVGEELGVPIEVYGPQMHMTRVVRLALEGGA